MASVVKTLGISASARMLTLPVTAAATILTTYLIVKELGVQSYAYIVLVGALFQLIPFADLGLGAAIVSSTARRLESREKNAAALATANAAFKVLWISAFVLISISLIIGFFDGWPVLLGLPNDFAKSSGWAISIVLLPFALSIPFGIGQRILLGEGRSHVVSLLGMLGPIVATLTTIVLLKTGADPLVLGMATPTGILVVSVVSFIFALRVSGWTFREVTVTKRIRRRPKLWNSAGPMLVISVTVPLALQSDRLVLSHFSNSVELSEYSVAAQMYAPCFSIVSMAAVALWPIFTRSGSASRALWTRAISALGVGGIVLGLVFALLVGPISSLVTEGKLKVGADLALSFGALLLTMSCHQASAALLTAPSQLAFQAVCSSAMLLSNVAISIALAPRFGASGVVMASVASVVCTQLFPCIIRARRFLTLTPEPVKV